MQVVSVPSFTNAGPWHLPACGALLPHDIAAYFVTVSHELLTHHTHRRSTSQDRISLQGVHSILAQKFHDPFLVIILLHLLRVLD